MTLQELLDVIGVEYNDSDLKTYTVVGATSKEGERYKVRGVWLDHDTGSVVLGLTPRRIKKD